MARATGPDWTIEAMTTAQQQTTMSIKPMQVMVVGRIDSVELHGGFRYTKVTAPAVDAYSYPDVVEIRSKRPIGSKGEEVRVLGRLGGYKKKPFSVTDKETGEVRFVSRVEMYVTLVEED